MKIKKNKREEILQLLFFQQAEEEKSEADAEETDTVKDSGNQVLIQSVYKDSDCPLAWNNDEASWDNRTKK